MHIENVMRLERTTRIHRTLVAKNCYPMLTLDGERASTVQTPGRHGEESSNRSRAKKKELEPG